MNAIKEARQIITADPNSEESLISARLVPSMESEVDFPLVDMYTLKLSTFNLSLEILKEWRLDRYYARKGKLLDVSYRAHVMTAH